jgi:hypothetical protein
MSGGRRHYCVVMKRLPGVSRAEFLRVWLGEHRAQAVKLPGVMSATFMPTAEDDERADGVGLLSFASQSDLDRARGAVTPTVATTPMHTMRRKRSGSSTYWPLPRVWERYAVMSTSSPETKFAWLNLGISSRRTLLACTHSGHRLNPLRTRREGEGNYVVPQA